eukprot:10395942-Karenia_brevis.AAC.1
MRPRRGELDGGVGGCLMVVTSGRRKAFRDGCGLSSPGRWDPRQRVSRGAAFTGRLRNRLAELLSANIDTKLLAIQLELGRSADSPLMTDLLESGRKIWREELKVAGFEVAEEPRPG